MRPFFSFYGGKWRDTPRNYPRAAFKTIVEPFAGSAGYSTRNANRNVILCDRDPVIAGVWDFLINESERSIRCLPLTIPDGGVDDLDVSQEARWLIGFWLNRGSAAPRKKPSSWMRSGVRPGSFWGEAVRDRIARQVRGIRHWQSFHADYRDFSRGRNPLATWFVDPPYVGQGHHYRYGTDDIDYTELGSWCRERLGQVIVCEGDAATWMPFQVIGDFKTTRKLRRSCEAVWTSNSEQP